MAKGRLKMNSNAIKIAYNSAVKIENLLPR
jgi:hypothetical protein